MLPPPPWGCLATRNQFCKQYQQDALFFSYTEWHTKCHTVDCTHNTFLLLQKHLTSGIELILIGWKIVSNESVNCLFARSPSCTKVCTKTSLSRYYTLCFCIKQYNFHLLIYSEQPVIRHFTNWWHLSHFPWTTTFTRTFPTSILWCYNFNGMIKWYDISCATLYINFIIFMIIYKGRTLRTLEYSFITTHFCHLIRHNAHPLYVYLSSPRLRVQSNWATEECVSVLSVVALVTRSYIDHGHSLRSNVMKFVSPVLRQSHNPQTDTMCPSLADTSFCSSNIKLTLNKT